MIRLLSCEPWPVSKLNRFLDQFLEGIISLFSHANFFAKSLFFGCGSRYLRLLRPRADGGLGIVGEDLGNAKHRELVAVAALATRVLAPALLEGDHLRAALVLQ